MPNAQDAFQSETPSNSQVTLKGSYMHFLGEGKQECVCLVLCCTLKSAPEPARLLFVAGAMCTHAFDSSDMLSLPQHSKAQHGTRKLGTAWYSTAQHSTSQHRIAWQSKVQHA